LTETSTFFVDQDSFAYFAMQPQGDHDGVVGTWALAVHQTGSKGLLDLTETWDLRADQTVTVSQVLNGSTEATSGTFVTKGADDVTVTLQTGSPGGPANLKVKLTLLGNATLGVPLHRQ
jgi:hypothetical protein